MIEAEIGGDYSITNAHACDLTKCLVRPKRRNVRFYGRAESQIREVWIVLEEEPDSLDGFKIFFDEDNRTFGLVQDSDPYGLACNVHKSFIDSFKSM